MLLPLVFVLKVWVLVDISLLSFKALKLSRTRNAQRQPVVDRNGLTKAEKLRRRKLKEHLVMWLVWVVWFRGEVWADRTVAFFVPFYDEIKVIVMCVLLTFKVSTSELIFRAVFRPLVSPYEPLVDPILYHFQTMVHVVVLITSYPFNPIKRWYYAEPPTTTDISPDDSMDTSLTMSSYSSLTRSCRPGQKMLPGHYFSPRLNIHRSVSESLKPKPLYLGGPPERVEELNGRRREPVRPARRPVSLFQQIEKDDLALSVAGDDSFSLDGFGIFSPVPAARPTISTRAVPKRIVSSASTITAATKKKRAAVAALDNDIELSKPPIKRLRTVSTTSLPKPSISKAARIPRPMIVDEETSVVIPRSGTMAHRRNQISTILKDKSKAPTRKPKALEVELKIKSAKKPRRIIVTDGQENKDVKVEATQNVDLTMGDDADISNDVDTFVLVSPTKRKTHKSIVKVSTRAMGSVATLKKNRMKSLGVIAVADDSGGESSTTVKGSKKTRN